MSSPFRLALIALVALCSACESTEQAYYRGGDQVRLIEAVPATRPEWLNSTPQSDGRFYYFVGASENASTEARAKDMAVADALKKAAAYAGVSITDKSERTTESRFKASETADPSISETERLLQSARAYFSRFRADQYYVEHFGRLHKKQIMDSSYRASVLLSIPVPEVDAAVEESRKRHETAPEERVSLEELKVDEADFAARIQKLRGVIEQIKRNESLMREADELQKRTEILEQRLSTGLSSSNELAELRKELDSTEERASSYAVSGNALFAAAIQGVKLREEYLNMLNNLLDMAVTSGLECKVNTKELKTEVAHNNNRKVVVRVPFSISVRSEYAKTWMERVLVYFERLSDDIKNICYPTSTSSMVSMIFRRNEISPDLINVVFPDDAAKFWFNGWMRLSAHFIFKDEEGNAVYMTNSFRLSIYDNGRFYNVAILWLGKIQYETGLSHFAGRYASYGGYMGILSDVREADFQYDSEITTEEMDMKILESVRQIQFVVQRGDK